MTASSIQPGFIALHSHRSEVLADTLTGWLRAHPLLPLESEVVLVQSNGMAEWIKIELARQGGVCAATRVELPSRFLWQAYRAVLGRDGVPEVSPFDKPLLLWRLMRLLPDVMAEPAYAPLRRFLARDADLRKRFQLAERLADLFDQYQVYRADWLADWQAGRDGLAQTDGQWRALADDDRWQPALWRALLADIAAERKPKELAKRKQMIDEKQAEIQQLALPVKHTWTIKPAG